MKEQQIEELEEQIKSIIASHLDYLDLGNPEVPEVKNGLLEDIIEVVTEFVDERRDKK